MKAKATSFATYKDLTGYIKCRDSGGTQSACLRKGDNGIGYCGDITATTKKAMVAIPAAAMIAEFGATAKARGKRVRVTVQGAKPFFAEVRDIAPAGIIDLNPGALIAAGLDQETELSAPAEWEWV